MIAHSADHLGDSKKLLLGQSEHSVANYKMDTAGLTTEASARKSWFMVVFAHNSPFYSGARAPSKQVKKQTCFEGAQAPELGVIFFSRSISIILCALCVCVAYSVVPTFRNGTSPRHAPVAVCSAISLALDQQ